MNTPLSNRFRTLALLVALILAAAPILLLAQQAQGPIQPTQQTATHMDAAIVAQSSAASNTITITPPNGQYVYLTGLDIENCATGTNVTAAAQTAVTTTGFATNPQWQIGVGPTAGLCFPQPVNFGPYGLKSQTPGSNVTVVVPANGTNQTLRANVYYYFAP